MIKKNIIYIFSYLTILVGFYLNEDVLGGSKGDYEYHLKFIELFSSDVSLGLKKFGYEGYFARNSPIFYIILSKLNEIFSLNHIRLINTLGSVLIAIIFYKTLKIKFNNVNKKNLKLLSCILFLSPTIRSLSIWPYPILWALIFFLISIYFFIRFKNSRYNENKFFHISLIGLILSSYLHYNFACFAIFYFFKFYQKRGIDFEFVKALILCFILSIPAVFFIFFRGEIHVFHGPSGFPVEFKDLINISNKILIISSIISIYFVFYYNYKQFIKEPYQNIKNNKHYLLLLIPFFVLIFFFNYPVTENFGGGIVFKFSNKIINNNLLFYIFTLYSLILIFTHLSQKDNFIIFCILMLFYNIQFTIYIKYYDPLIYFLLFFLFDTKLNDTLFKNKYYLEKIYSFCFLMYCFFIFKNNFTI